MKNAICISFFLSTLPFFINRVYSQHPLTATITPAFSIGCNNGNIDLHIVGGFPPYQLQWYKNNVPAGDVIETSGSDGLEDLHNASPANYNVDVYDALCGNAMGKFVVGVLPNLVNLVNIQNNLECYTQLGGLSNLYDATGDGAIQIDVNLTVPYSLRWFGPNGFSSTDEDIDELCPGLYTLQVSNSLGCVHTQNISICCCAGGDIPRIQGCMGLSGDIPLCDENYVFPIEVDYGFWGSTDNDVTCTGFIFPQVTGGSGNSAYIWTLPNGSLSSDQYLSNICSGTYCLTIEDGCTTASLCWTIANCDATIITLDATIEESCGDDGSISLFDSPGGQRPIHYTWDGGSNGQTIANLAPGQYCVTATDAQNCRAIKCFEVIASESHEEYRGNCTFVTVCKNHNGSTRSGTISYTQDEDNCHKYYRICYDDALPGGFENLTPHFTTPYYVYGANQNDPTGCNWLLEMCAGRDFIPRNSDDQFHHSIFANEIAVEAFDLDGSWNPDIACGNCWSGTLCDYFTHDDFNYVIDPVSQWVVTPYTEELHTVCPELDTRCILQAFCYLNANPSGNDEDFFWFGTECLEVEICELTPEEQWEFLAICIDPPSDGEFHRALSNQPIQKPTTSKSLDLLNNFSISIFPNPFLNEVIIKFNGTLRSHEVFSISITTIEGRSVLFEKSIPYNNEINLNLEMLNSGAYLISIENTDKIRINNLITKI